MTSQDCNVSLTEQWAEAAQWEGSIDELLAEIERDLEAERRAETKLRRAYRRIGTGFNGQE